MFTYKSCCVCIISMKNVNCLTNTRSQNKNHMLSRINYGSFMTLHFFSCYLTMPQISESLIWIRDKLLSLWCYFVEKNSLQFETLDYMWTCLPMCHVIDVFELSKFCVFILTSILSLGTSKANWFKEFCGWNLQTDQFKVQWSVR